MGQGRSCLDIVRMQRVHTELASGTQIHYGTLLWDLVQFSEHIGHQELVRQGITCLFPLHVLVYTISTFTWTRNLLLDGAYSEGITPVQEIVVGSTPATCEAKAS
eukprot:881917-Pyramimonas_sp.AAC.1